MLGILPGIIGTIQANETVKLLLGIGNPLVGRLLLFDALDMEFREVKLRKDPACPLCGEHPTIRKLVDYEAFCGAGPSERPPQVPEITARELAGTKDRVLLVDVREPFEAEISRIPGAWLIPLGELPRRLGELDREADIVVHCKSGARSARAVKLLLESGFTRVKNLKGGILAWTDEVDSSLLKY